MFCAVAAVKLAQITLKLVKCIIIGCVVFQQKKIKQNVGSWNIFFEKLPKTQIVL